MNPPGDAHGHDVSDAELRLRFDAMRAAFAREPWPDAAKRRDRLARVLAIVRDHEDDFVAAIDRDFGHRSAQAYERLDRNREITQRLRGLQTDSRMLEEAARSTLGVVHEDEIVVVFRNARGSRRR